MDFMGMHLTLWKLHTMRDYMTFALAFVAGIAVLWYMTRRLKSQRNDASATFRVCKRLSKLWDSDGAVFSCRTSAFAGAPLGLDGILVQPNGVCALRCIGWGLRVFGNIDGSHWRMLDNSEERSVPNPIHEAQAAADFLSAWLEQRGVTGCGVKYMVVVADPYQNAEFFLERGARVLSYDGLKSWSKENRHKAATLNVKRISDLLEQNGLKRM